MTAPHVLHRDPAHSRHFLPQELMGVGTLANILSDDRCQVTAAELKQYANILQVVALPRRATISF